MASYGAYLVHLPIGVDKCYCSSCLLSTALFAFSEGAARNGVSHYKNGANNTQCCTLLMHFDKNTRAEIVIGNKIKLCTDGQFVQDVRLAKCTFQ